MKTYTVRIYLQQEEDGRWSVSAPNLPGCAPWGHTREEAIANMQEAVTGYIETLIQECLQIPPIIKASDEPEISVIVSAA
ncbi:MAG: type II toxin-antitoxin system HicB family antitoxin [Chloroflexi bacterium]|nr:type II toxin-antitoxin system HicB family antitoxin [Chloroflexota bacterium]